MHLRITNARDIAAPPSAAWRLLADFGSIARWAPVIEHSSLLGDQPGGVGAERRIRSGRTVAVERVTVWEVEIVLAYTVDGLPPPVEQAAITWVIRPAGTGASVAVIADLTTASGIAGFLGSIPLRVRTRRLERAMLDAMAAALGGTPVPDPGQP